MNMRHLLTTLILFILIACSKSKSDVKAIGEMATIDKISAHRISAIETATEIDITVKDTSLTGLELFYNPGFPVGKKIINPRTGHYTIIDTIAPGRFRIELTTEGWRYILPDFTLIF